MFVEHWSRDGRFLIYCAAMGGRDGIWAVPLLGDRKPFTLVPGPYFHDEAQLSPDGEFLAFESPESGETEVFVQPFPGPGPRKRVSNNGGGEPRWRGDGRELFYLALDGTLMAVDIRAGATLEPGIPRRLFSTPLLRRAGSDDYSVTRDGQRFLVPR